MKLPARRRRQSVQRTTAAARLGVQRLEDRTNPSGTLMAVGAGAGGGPHVQAFDAQSQALKASFFAYDASFSGGVRVAVGDVDGDGIDDLITAPGPGGGPHVKVISGKNLSLISSFMAYHESFLGGVNLAVGNFDADPAVEIVTGAGAGGGPHIHVYDVVNGGAAPLAGLVGNFFAYNTAFLGGVHVAVGDVNGDGQDDIVTGAGPGGGPHVQAFDGATAATIRSFLAFHEGFGGGVTVAAADTQRDGVAEIFAGTATGDSFVTVFGPGGQVGNLQAFDPAFQGGVRLAAYDRGYDGRADLVATPAAGLAATARAFDGATLAQLGDLPVFPGFTGGVYVGGAARTPVLAGGADPIATFIDPTAQFTNPAGVSFGGKDYVAPFALFNAAQHPIAIGVGSNVQDNVILDATNGTITIGDQVILAHGATVNGPALIGAPGGLPSFLSFNAVVDRGAVEPDAVVSALGRVGPGVIIRSGMKVLPGKFVQTQAEADNPALGKVAAVTQADRTFMAGVLHVNKELARGYAKMYLDNGIRAVLGIGRDPGDSDFNTSSDAPRTADHPNGLEDLEFRNRIIGDVFFGSTLAQLDQALGNSDSIRADEGTPFDFGSFGTVGDRFTVHALEHTGITAGLNNSFGFHSIVHGGEDSGNTPTDTTTLGSNIVVQDWAVVFRSTIGSGANIGFRALVDGSQLADNTVVPDRAIIVDNVLIGFVEW